MPLYEYFCRECGKKFDVLQSIRSVPMEKCIYCQGRVEKMISVSSFQFKGNGWYITDYKRPRDTQEAKGESVTVGRKTTQDKKDKKNVPIH